MAISREKKEQLVAQYTDLLRQSRGVIITDYRGMNMNQLTELRVKLDDVEGKYAIVKNTLLKLALEAADMAVPEDVIDGPIALSFVQKDLASAAKVLLEASDDEDLTLVVKGGIIGDQMLNLADLERLTELPTLPELRAQLLGLLTSPASGIAGLMEAPARDLLGVIDAASSQLLNVVAAYAAQAEAEGEAA